MKKIRIKKCPTGGTVSELGYSDNSPYRNAKSLNIQGNNITMQNTGKNLQLIPMDEYGNMLDAIDAPAYSGEYNFPDAKSVLEIPKAQVGRKIQPILNGYNKIANKSAYLAPYGALNSTANHQHQNPDSLPEDILEILDPTGISSWDDVYRAGKDFVKNPSWMTGLSAGVEAAGAIPVLGKIGKGIKYGSKGINLLKKSTNLADIIGDGFSAASIAADNFQRGGRNVLPKKYASQKIAQNNNSNMTAFRKKQIEEAERKRVQKIQDEFNDRQKRIEASGFKPAIPTTVDKVKVTPEKDLFLPLATPVDNTVKLNSKGNIINENKEAFDEAFNQATKRNAFATRRGSPQSEQELANSREALITGEKRDMNPVDEMGLPIARNKPKPFNFKNKPKENVQKVDEFGLPIAENIPSNKNNYLSKAKDKLANFNSNTKFGKVAKKVLPYATAIGAGAFGLYESLTGDDKPTTKQTSNSIPPKDKMDAESWRRQMQPDKSSVVYSSEYNKILNKKPGFSNFLFPNPVQKGSTTIEQNNQNNNNRNPTTRNRNPKYPIANGQPINLATSQYDGNDLAYQNALLDVPEDVMDEGAYSNPRTLNTGQEQMYQDLIKGKNPELNSMPTDKTLGNLGEVIKKGFKGLKIDTGINEQLFANARARLRAKELQFPMYQQVNMQEPAFAEESERPYVNQIQESYNTAIQNINPNSTTGQAMVAQLQANASNQTNDVLGQVFSRNLQRRTDYFNNLSSMRNQEQLTNQQLKQQYVQGVQGTIANRDSILNNLDEDLANKLSAQKQFLNNTKLGLWMAGTPSDAYKINDDSIELDYSKVPMDFNLRNRQQTTATEGTGKVRVFKDTNGDIVTYDPVTKKTTRIPKSQQYL